MKLMWKRTVDNKKVQFECEVILTGRVNFNNVILSKKDIEKDYLIESIQSVIEEHYFENKKKAQLIKEQNDSLKDEKLKVRNHFRNVCFRKKFRTIKEHIEYVANYYGINDIKVLSYVEEDLPIIKRDTNLK